MPAGDNVSRDALEQRALLGMIAADLMHDVRGSLAVLQLSLQVAETHLQSPALKGSALEEARTCVDDALDAVAHLERLSSSVHLLERAFTTKPRRGSGIGLAHVLAVAERHGGAVRVDSSPGEGSLFEVRLARAHLCEGDAWQTES